MGETVDPETGEIVPYQPIPLPQQKALEPFRGLQSEGGVYTNIPMEPAFADVLVNCSGTHDKLAKQVVGQVLDVTHYFAHQVLREDKTRGGEVLGWRCVLVTKERVLIACSGPAIVRAVDMLTRIRGNKPWDPPIACEIVANVGRDSFTYHTLKIHPNIPTAKPVSPASRK